MTKRLIALLISVMMVVTLLPSGIFAEDPTRDGKMSVPGRYGIIDTPLSPVSGSIPDVEEPAQGDYFFDLKAAPVRIPTVEEGLEAQQGVTLWEGDNVNFGENGTGIVTFVIKATGIETPVSLTRLLPTRTLKNDPPNKDYAFNFTWGGGNAGLDGVGTEHPIALNIPKDGTYVISIGSKVFGMSGGGNVLAVSKLKVADINNAYKGVYPLVNDNENAQLSLLSISAGNPTVTANFYGEDGTLIGTATQEYPKASEWNDPHTAKKSTCKTVDDMFALTGEDLPTKVDPNGEYKYVLQWVDGEGNPVDAIYKNMNVFATFVPFASNQAIVTFLDENGKEIKSEIIDKGNNPPECAAPPKNATEDVIYTFAGWTVDGENVVDMATYEITEDVTFKPVFVEDKILKAEVVFSAESVNMGETVTATVKLNRADLTTGVSLSDGTSGVAANVTEPITSGEVVLSYNKSLLSTEGGDGTLTASFTRVEADGTTDATVTFNVAENAAGQAETAVQSGKVSTASITDREVIGLSAKVAVTGQQAGKYYGESAEVIPLNKNNGETPPEAQLIWQDDIEFGDQYAGVTFVLKATGIETPVNLSNINPTLRTTSNENDTFKYRWFYYAVNENAPFWGGAKEPSRYMKIDKDGYYLFYMNSRLFDMNKFLGAKEFRVFFDDGVNKVSRESTETTVKCNTNENAALQMVAVVAGDLQPTVTFHDAEGDVITSAKHDYTTVGMAEPNDGNLTKQTMQLMTAQDIFGTIEGAEIPVKTPEAGKEYLRYDFKGWAYKDGTPADGIYMNVDVYPVYEEVDTRPDCTIKFMNGDEEYDTQIVKETELPVFPEIDPTKLSTDLYSYIFKGWDVNGDGEVDEPVPAVVEGATYTAVYEQVDRRWEVKFYAEDKETYLGSIYVLGEIKDGTTPNAPEKPADVQYSYTFDKWVYEDGNELVESEVTEDVSVYPSYTSTLNKYTVTYLDDDGTELAKVTVDYGTGATVADPTKAKDEYYTYTFSGWDADTSNVVGDMTATATYSKVFTKFDDVPADEWYIKQVEYVTVNKYFSGMTDTTFEPDTVATRAMVLRVLYSAAGKPSVEGMTNPFGDVPADEWYAPAVIWGFNVGVAYGKSETEFDPDGTVLREEFCSFIYRFAEKVYLIDGKHVDMSIPKSDVTSSLATFKDKNDIDSWAQNAIKWCKYAGIVRGTDTDKGTFFYPRNGLTRAELATMIKGFFESDKVLPVK